VPDAVEDLLVQVIKRKGGYFHLYWFGSSVWWLRYVVMGNVKSILFCAVPG
jgi:hypothetical protein